MTNDLRKYKTFRQIVKMITEKDKTAFHEIKMSFEHEKISWNDHETLRRLAEMVFRDNRQRMINLKCIIDTWRIIDKYNITEYEQIDDTTIQIPECEYERVLESAENKEYILNLRRETGITFGK